MAELKHRRSRGNRENTKAGNFLHVTGKMSIAELHDLMREYGIPVDGQLNITMIMWDSAPTPDEVARWVEADRKHHERAQRWRRETYERLRAEFEGE